MAHKRYHLQRRERMALPNVLGNHSMPVYTYRWKTIAVSDEQEPLEEHLIHCTPQEDYRIEDTLAALAGKGGEG